MHVAIDRLLLSIPRRRDLAAALLISTAALSAGCAGLAERVANRVAEQRVSQATYDVALIRGELALFRQCFETRGGACAAAGAGAPLPLAATGGDADLQPLRCGLSAALDASVTALGDHHPARDAREALSHPFLEKITTLHNGLRGLDETGGPGLTIRRSAGENGEGGEMALTLTTRPEEVRDFYDKVNAATLAGGWEALAEHATRRLRSVQASPEERREARRLAFLQAYMAAYFEHGQFFQIELDLSHVEERLGERLKDRFPLLCGVPENSDDCDRLVRALAKSLLRDAARSTGDSAFLFGTLGSQGLVTRTGQQLKFPGLMLSLDPLGSDSLSLRNATSGQASLSQVGPDMVTVLLEALFDAHEGLPAAAGATGLALPEKDAAFRLPLFQPTTAVSEDDFGKMVNISTRTGAVVFTSVDRLIQGIGPFSLDNTAIEQLIAQTVAVTTRKVVEKASWCYYACQLDQDLARVKAEARDDLERDLHQAAQQVRLRLRIE